MTDANSDKNSYWILFSETPEAPVVRRHVRAKNREDVRALVYSHHSRARVYGVGLVTDAETETNTVA